MLYKAERFLHLTGVDTYLSGAKDFYKKSIKRQLTQKQISFSERHSYDLCKRKMDYLSVINKLTCENIKVVEDMTTESAFYVFGFTELNFTLGLFEDRDSAGTLKSEFLIPASLRTDDCISKSNKVHNINLILKKSNTEKYYNEILYTDSKDHFCIMEHYELNPALICERNSMEFLTSQVKAFLNQGSIACIKRSEQNTSFELELLDMHAAKSLVVVPMTNEKWGMYGMIILLNTSHN